MAFAVEDYESIRTYLGYPYSDLTNLTNYLNQLAITYGNDWVDRVIDTFAEIDAAIAAYDAAISTGTIRRVKYDGEYEIEYPDSGKSKQSAAQTNYRLALAKLVDLTGLRVYSSQSPIYRG